MASIKNNSQLVNALLGTIRLCVNALESSRTEAVPLESGSENTSEQGIEEEKGSTKVESAVLLLLEETCYSVHSIRTDFSRGEYKVSPIMLSLEDNPDGTGGGYRAEIVPYCFACHSRRKKWQVIHVHSGEENIWEEDHDICRDFWGLINNPQIPAQDKRPVFQALLSTLYTQECLDNRDVKELIIALPEQMGAGTIDLLKAESAEKLPRQIVERDHLFSLLTDKTRYVRMPSSPSILFSLLRSIEGIPDDEQLFTFFHSNNTCTVGNLNKQGTFEQETYNTEAADIDIDMNSVYAVGIVDEGKLQHLLLEKGYYNFLNEENASYMAKTLAIIQEDALEAFKITELLERLGRLQKIRDRLKLKLVRNNEQISRLQNLISLPLGEFIENMMQDVR